MSRKRTGLRNRMRPDGRSKYQRAEKGAVRDTYGTWAAGKQTRPDVIAGRTLPLFKPRFGGDEW